MDIDKLYEVLGKLVKDGHGKHRLFDYDNPEFAITEISTKLVDDGVWIYFEMDEVNT